MIKLITIKNDSALKKFYFLLPLYKSKIFYYTTFTLQEDKYNITNLVKALNIKNKKQRLEYIYDEACLEIDKSITVNNICGFVNNRCGMQRKNNKHHNGCCRTCKYQTSNGCQEKNLACKLFFCSYVKDKYKTLDFNDIIILKMLNINQRIIIKDDYFSTKEEVLKDLSYSSLVIGTFRIFYRLIQNKKTKH